ncbi:MAG: hypothetical protein RI556_12215, partial [Hydrogenovibrio sp.]|uniref:hypothetical protein n=1 Tax=Hydrogenovibrio sp. TaxID=2065821 RepID=UPI00286FDB26
ETKFTELFNFIQAPGHGFLIVDVLENFVEIDEAIPEPDFTKALKGHLETAKTLLALLESFQADPNFFHLHSKTYLDALRKQVDLFDIEAQRFFLAHCIFKKYRRSERYISARPLYVSLFYPYIDKTIAGDDDLNDVRITYRQLRAAAFLELSKNDLGGHLDKYKNLYEGIARSSDHRFYHPIKIRRATNVVNASTAIRGIYECLRINRKEQGDEDFMAEVNAKHDVTGVKDIYRLAEDQYTQLVRFFKYFLPNEKKGTGQAQRLKPRRRSSYNTTAGMVVLDETDDRVASTSQVILGEQEHELIQTKPNVDDAIGEEIIVDKSNPCSKKRPHAIFSKSRAVTHHLALANQHLPNILRQRDISVVWDTLVRDLAVNPEAFIGPFLYGVGLLLLGREDEFFQFDPLIKDPERVCFDLDLTGVSFPILAYSSKVVVVPDLYQDADDTRATCLLPGCIKRLVTTHLSWDQIKKIGRLKRSDFDAYLEQTFPDHRYYRTSFIRQWVFDHYHALSDGDVWQASLVTNKCSFLSQTILHYASIKQRCLEQLVADHWQSIAPSCFEKELPSVRPRRIGSPFFPKIEPLVQILRTVRNTLDFYLEMLAYWVLPSDVLVEVWNLLAFYTDQWIAYTCATRNTQDPFIHPNSIMRSGWTLIDDKHIEGGRNAREVYVSDALRQQLETFLAIREIIFHKAKDRSNVPLPGLKQTTVFSIGEKHDRYLLRQDLCLLTLKDGAKKQITPFPYTRGAGVEKVHEALTMLARKKFFQKKISRQQREYVRHYKENTNRHFLRGMLVDLDVAPAHINALMGHYHQGTESWGGRSIFNTQRYRSAIERGVPEIEKLLALKPVTFLGVRAFDRCGMPKGYINEKDKEGYFSKHKAEIKEEAVIDARLP